MIARWALRGAICAGMVVLPALFESYTFNLYVTRESSFFTFSGARLWVFLTSEIVLGFALGRLSSGTRLYFSAGIVALSILMLVILLYYSCDIRQCYYAGPDGLGAIRLGTLLFSAALAGLLIGDRSRKVVSKMQRNDINALLFGAATVVLLGYYPYSMIFGLYMTAELWTVLLVFASSTPFFLSGLICHFFSDRKENLPVYSAAAGGIVLAALFVNLRPIGWPLAVMMLATGIPAAILGFRRASWLERIVSRARSQTIILASLIALFALVSVHPLLDAPMNLGMEDDEVLAKPTNYSGAYHHSDKYFGTKRVEVSIDIQQFESGSLKDFVLAGIGVQSPNCCKDGLDYAYRADLLFNESGGFLIARAWETCDQNIACSGFPWISTMHQSITLIPDYLASSSVMLAMEWRQGGQVVDWYYKPNNGSWSNYSAFDAPAIENQYFNIGVISVGIPYTNGKSGNAYFFQTGVSVPQYTNDFGEISFSCPAYYDENGVRHCAEMSPVNTGDSHWKVLWKWGVPNEIGLVRSMGSSVIVESR